MTDANSLPQAQRRLTLTLSADMADLLSHTENRDILADS